MERLDAEIDRALESLGSDRDRLARAVAAYLGFAWRHRSSWQLITSARSSPHPAVREATQARTDRLPAPLTGPPAAPLPVRGGARTRGGWGKTWEVRVDL